MHLPACLVARIAQALDPERPIGLALDDLFAPIPTVDHVVNGTLVLDAQPALARISLTM
jgi:hypothetical protein